VPETESAERAAADILREGKPAAAKLSGQGHHEAVGEPQLAGGNPGTNVMKILIKIFLSEKWALGPSKSQLPTYPSSS
jgi:hypothetical protein